MKLAMILCTVVVACVAECQPGPPPDVLSIETRIARADVVLRGSIRSIRGSFESRVDGFNGGYLQDGVTPRPNGVMKFRMIIKVDEVLKGKSPPDLEFVIETFAGDQRYIQWARAHTSFLWLLGNRNGAGQEGGESRSEQWIRLGNPVPDERSFMGDMPPYAMDFRRLTESKSLLSAARQQARRPADPSLKFHTFPMIPGDVNGFGLVVPVRPPLELIARRMILSPDEFFPKGSDDSIESERLYLSKSTGSKEQRSYLRIAGIEAIQYYKTKENVELLASLLKDPTTRVEGDAIAYPVRKAAVGVLSSWGVDVGKPVLKESIGSAKPPRAFAIAPYLNRTPREFEMLLGKPEAITRSQVGEWFTYGRQGFDTIKVLDPGATDEGLMIVIKFPLGSPVHTWRDAFAAIGLDPSGAILDGYTISNVAQLGTGWARWDGRRLVLEPKRPRFRFL